MASAPRNLLFDQKLNIAVPGDLHDAIRKAAKRKKLSIADYVRGALSDRLSADGVQHIRLANLSARSAP